MSALSADLLLGGAFAVTQIAALRLGERAGLDSRAVFWLTVLGAVGALLAGSLWTATVSSDAGLLEVVLTGERGVMAALAGAAAAGVAWLAFTRRPVLAYVDAVMPAVFLGYAIARLACFVDGHCFGIVTDLPFGITYPAGTNAHAAQVAAGLIGTDAARSMPTHPTQLYHAAAGVLGFALLLRIPLKPAGTRTALALLGYGGARFVIEFFRGDAQPVMGALDLNQMLCLLMMACGISLCGARHAFARRSR